MKDRLNGISRSFCLAKWTQLNLQLHTGQTHSCHHPAPHPIDPSRLIANPSAVHNTSEKLKARAQMLNGERPAECEHCWNMEDIGESSDRVRKSSGHWSAPYFQSILDSGLGERFAPSYVEVAFDSTCNLKCAYCTPSNSTSWLQEIKRFGAYPTSGRFNDLGELAARHALPTDSPSVNPYADAFWKWWPEIRENLDVLRITGGEPLLSAHTWRLFDLILESARPSLGLAINSNLAVDSPLIEKLIDRLNRINGKVMKLEVFVSMDTHGARAEYIRHGLNYGRFISHAHRILSNVHKPFSFHFMMTVSALSVGGTDLFLKDVAELKNSYPRHDIAVDPSYLRHPSFMNVRVLPADSISHLESALAYMESGNFTKPEIERLRRVARWMRLSPLPAEALKKERADFYRMFREYDRRRGTDFIATFPEHLDFWSDCAEAASQS